MGFESGECKVAEGGVLSFNAFRGEDFERDEFELGIFFGGETQFKKFRKFSRARKFPVERTLGYPSSG